MLVGDTLGIECLVQALQQYTEARSAHDRAYAEFVAGGGYSWGYHGGSYVRDYEEAATEFGKRLEEFVDGRVAKALAEHGIEGGTNVG